MSTALTRLVSSEAAGQPDLEQIGYVHNVLALLELACKAHILLAAESMEDVGVRMRQKTSSLTGSNRKARIL